MYLPFENSTTRTAIMLSNNNSTVLDKKVVLQNTQKHYKKKLDNNSVIILIKREELKWRIDICQLTYIIGPAKLFTLFRLDPVKKTDVSADGALTIKLFQIMYYSKFGSKQSKSNIEKK